MNQVHLLLLFYTFITKICQFPQLTSLPMHHMSHVSPILRSNPRAPFSPASSSLSLFLSLQPCPPPVSSVSLSPLTPHLYAAATSSSPSTSTDAARLFRHIRRNCKHSPSFPRRPSSSGRLANSGSRRSQLRKSLAPPCCSMCPE